MNLQSNFNPATEQSWLHRPRFYLALISLVAGSFVLLATARFGAGLSPDSIGYLQVARSIESGNGVPDSFVLQPPFYPALLAAIGWIFSGADPLFFANVVCAILFAAIVYETGVFLYLFLSAVPAVLAWGILATASAPTLMGIGIMALSESLFIFLTIVCLRFTAQFFQSGARSLLLFAALAASLACLTRYAGVALVFAVALSIFFKREKDIGKRVGECVYFLVFALLPLAVWLGRNYIVTNTLMGNRPSSAAGIIVNLDRIQSTALQWKTVLLAFALVTTTSVYVLLVRRGSMNPTQSIMNHVAPALYFVPTYLVFILISASLSAMDPIDNRLLSPIIVPLIVIIAAAVANVVTQLLAADRAFQAKIIPIILMLTLIPSVFAVSTEIRNARKNGTGTFSNIYWQNSPLLYFLRTHTFNEKVYSNGPDVLILYGIADGVMSPVKSHYQSNETVGSLESYRGHWPTQEQAYLVWFNAIRWRTYLFSPAELSMISDMRLIAAFPDGVVYQVLRPNN